MKSERLACRRAVLYVHPIKSKKRRVVVRWACLPSELLPIISGCLQDAADIIRFRSVCRSWRLSTPLLHKISPFFPVVFSIPADFPVPDYDSQTEIVASAVYLLRPRRDPSNAWIVYAQESAPGKLIFRNPMTLSKLPNEKWPNLSSDEWSSVTRIARSCNQFSTCSSWEGQQWGTKFALVTPKFSNPRSGSDQLIRLGIWSLTHRRLFVYSRGGGGHPTTGKSFQGRVIDFTVLNGQIYAAEYYGVLYVVDPTKLELIPLIRDCNINRPRLGVFTRLVGWDGGLYIVYYYPSLSWCDCFRLVEDEGDCRWEKVEDLGDGVLFLSRDSAYSVSARDLPPPWRGNSIVVYADTWSSYIWSCTWTIEVYELGVKGALISSFPGYSELFDPPLSRSS
ncbi:uncharacterized protein [Phyllobates terribilis]|uniref:uncharacterized protein n=1 Tax=Phyllobates terribilis TaxID=111132 RepID=UPI003CCB2809